MTDPVIRELEAMANKWEGDFKFDGRTNRDYRVEKEIVGDIRALIARAKEEAKPKLIWYRWVCINGHSNDHAKLAPDGTKMCATQGCQAEAEPQPVATP
jgi:hypothetical protein